jgi:hypothetical protein
VLLMVTNVAPDGSLLDLRDVTGTIALPKGVDRVAGALEQQGDDPLRLARIEGVGIHIPDSVFACFARTPEKGPDLDWRSPGDASSRGDRMSKLVIKDV